MMQLKNLSVPSHVASRQTSEKPQMENFIVFKKHGLFADFSMGLGVSFSSQEDATSLRQDLRHKQSNT